MTHLTMRNSKKLAATLAVSAAIAMAGCQSMSRVDQNTLAGGVVGGGLGALTAAAFGASAGWVVVAGAAGAAVGSLYARNASSNQCAYSNGDGTYYVAPCP